MKYIQKKSTAEIPEVNGAVVDTRNVADKTTNAYSARIIDEMNTYSTEETIIGYFKKADGMIKPVYRKFNETNVTATGNITLIETGSLDDIFDLCICKKGAGNHDKFTDGWWSVKSTGKITCAISSTGTYTCCITYTKLTD